MTCFVLGFFFFLLFFCEYVEMIFSSSLPVKTLGHALIVYESGVFSCRMSNSEVKQKGYSDQSDSDESFPGSLPVPAAFKLR